MHLNWSFSLNRLKTVTDYDNDYHFNIAIVKDSVYWGDISHHHRFNSHAFAKKSKFNRYHSLLWRHSLSMSKVGEFTKANEKNASETKTKRKFQRVDHWIGGYSMRNISILLMLNNKSEKTKPIQHIYVRLYQFPAIFLFILLWFSPSAFHTDTFHPIKSERQQKARTRWWAKLYSSTTISENFIFTFSLSFYFILLCFVLVPCSISS